MPLPAILSADAAIDSGGGNGARESRVDAPQSPRAGDDQYPNYDNGASPDASSPSQAYDDDVHETVGAGESPPVVVFTDDDESAAATMAAVTARRFQFVTKRPRFL